MSTKDIMGELVAGAGAKYPRTRVIVPTTWIDPATSIPFAGGTARAILYRHVSRQFDRSDGIIASLI